MVAAVLLAAGLATPVAASGARPGGPESVQDVYVACFSTNDGYFVDAASLAVAGPLALAPEGSFPYDAAIHPAGHEVWHLGAGGDHVLVIDRATNAIVRRIPVGQYPVGIAFSPDGALAYVSCRDDERMDVIDTATYAVVRSLVMPAREDPGKLAVDAATGLVYMAQAFGPRVYEIAADGSAILRSALLGDNHWAIAVSPDGAHLYVTERDALLNLVRDVDRASLTESRTIGVGRDPWALDVTADGSTLVVACEDSATVHVIDVAAWTSRDVPLPASTSGSNGPQDLDIDDARGRALVAGGRVGPVATATAVVYSIDLATATIAATVPIGGCYKTSVIAAQGRAGPPVCPPALGEAGPLRAAKDLGDVRLAWPALGGALDGYNVWRVDDRTALPIASSPPGPGVVGVCVPAAAPTCTDPGAVPGPGGTTWFYQVRGVCGGSEGA